MVDEKRENENGESVERKVQLLRGRRGGEEEEGGSAGVGKEEGKDVKDVETEGG